MRECPTPTKTPMATELVSASWWARVWSEGDGTPSSRRMLFALVVVYTLGLVTASLVIQHGIVDQTKDLIEALVWATAGTVTVSRFAENKGGAQ